MKVYRQPGHLWRLNTAGREKRFVVGKWSIRMMLMTLNQKKVQITTFGTGKMWPNYDNKVPMCAELSYWVYAHLQS